jgi:CxxC motif-containing protein (DUF1111 family)
MMFSVVREVVVPCAVFAALLLSACESAPLSEAEPGEPLPGLTAEQSARFHAGRALFNRIFTAEEGLGPAFNENQCSACHTVPAAGGTTGFERIVKATRFDSVDGCDVLRERGGENVRTQVTPLLRAHGVERESVPVEATEQGRFLPPFLFGLGLVEAIPEAEIAARADPDDADGDGVSGRAARSADGTLLRFGRKADHATIEEFTRSALLLEMGLTSRAGERDRVSGADVPAGIDPAPDPEVDEHIVQLLTDFVRLLTPPASAAEYSRAYADTVAAGRRIFARVGCESCHTPTMRTGASDVAAIAHRSVRLYSDLLLHDMGPALAGVCAYDASPRELRTAMLTGIQHRRMYLHDGRAMDLREAILAHGGEAQAARDAFARLHGLHQVYLLIFLRSL